MTGRCRLGLVAAGLAAAAIAGSPALVAAQDASQTPGPAPSTTAAPVPSRAQKASPQPAHLSLRTRGLHHHRVLVGQRARTLGYLRPFVAGQHVQVKLLRSGHVVKKLNPKTTHVPGTNKGRFTFRSPVLIKPGSYRFVAQHLPNGQQGKAIDRSPKFRIRYPDLHPGDRNGKVRLFKRLLLKDGYYTSGGSGYDAKAGFAVMAFRKVNGMSRTFDANPQIFKELADGRGRFRLKYPGAGRHVEVDISRQVMVLASHGKAKYTFHVSTGAPATPTIRGHYHFYSRQPGYNSEGMYYSVYWHGGYAIHGFASVPPYPASHGCVRNEIIDAKFAYDWVRLGMSIYVYG